MSDKGNEVYKEEIYLYKDNNVVIVCCFIISGVLLF